MKFEYQVWRLRPECRGAARDINNLAQTHILIADGVFAELPPDFDADVFAEVLTMKRQVEAVADGLELDFGDIIVYRGRAYSVDVGRVVSIGNVDNPPT
jgi:hypothetical protein